MVDHTEHVADELPILRFIPLRRADVLAMCLSEKRLAPVQEQQLKNTYATQDPDADTRVINE